jgi:hypothetical protein
MLTAIVNALQFPVVVQFAQKRPLVIPRATMPRFGDNSFRIFKLTPLRRLADFRFAARLTCNHQSEICNLKSDPC